MSDQVFFLPPSPGKRENLWHRSFHNVVLIFVIPLGGAAGRETRSLPRHVHNGPVVDRPRRQWATGGVCCGRRQLRLPWRPKRETWRLTHSNTHTHTQTGMGGGGRLLEMIAIRKVNELEVGGKGGLSFKGQFRLKGGRGKLEGPNLQQRIAISAIRG